MSEIAVLSISKISDLPPIILVSRQQNLIFSNSFDEFIKDDSFPRKPLSVHYFRAFSFRSRQIKPSSLLWPELCLSIDHPSGPLNDKYLKDIVHSLKLNKFIKKLTLKAVRNDQLTEHVVIEELSNLRHLSQLSHIRWSLSNFLTLTDKYLTAFIKSLRYFNLKSLDMYFLVNYDQNWLEEESLITLNKLLQKMKEMESVTLRFDNSDYNLSPCLEMLTKTLRDMKKLRSLKLVFDSNEKFGPNNLPFDLEGFHELRKLTLIMNSCESLNEDGFLMISNGLGKMESLEFLDIVISNNSLITDKSIEALSIALKNLVKIKKLILNLYYLEKVTNLRLISDPISNMLDLSMLKLNLSSSNIGFNCLDSVSACLISLEKLKILEISLDNSFDYNSEDFQKFSLSLYNKKTLKTLSLELIEVKIPSLLELKASIQSLDHLEDLNLSLSRCRLQVNDPVLITDALKVLPKLKALSLSFRKNHDLTDTTLLSVASILESSGKFKKVQLNFANCEKLTTEGLVFLLKQLIKNKEMIDLELHFGFCKQFEGLALGELAKSLVCLKKLEKLKLNFQGCDKFETEEYNKLIENLMKLDNLETLILNMGFKLNYTSFAIQLDHWPFLSNNSYV